MRFASLALLQLACSPAVRSPEPRDNAARTEQPPAWALPPPEERAVIARLTKQCRDYDAAIASLSAGRFLDAREARRRAEDVVEARRVAVLKGKTLDTTPAACLEDSTRLFSSSWFEMGVTLEEGLASASADERFEAYFKVAASETSLREEGRRRIGMAGLDHWLSEAQKRCDEFSGATEPCLRPLRLLTTIAPESKQATAAAAVVADARRVDAEIATKIRKVSPLLEARRALCARRNNSECQWANKNPLPMGKEKLAKYGDLEPGEERQPGLSEQLNAVCNLDEDEPSAFCAERHEILPRHACPSYWDDSPATQKLDQQWEALLREVPDGGRKAYLRDAWIEKAHGCTHGVLQVPGATK